MTKPDEPEALIERAARHVLDNSRKGNASLNEHQRAADDEKLMTSYRDIIGKALSFIAAHPVADAGGVTDADREAAAKCVEHGLSRPNPLNVRQGVVDSWHLVQAFARHRLHSVAAATAAKDAAIRARDDHFRNAQRLAEKVAAKDAEITELRALVDELKGRGARAVIAYNTAICCPKGVVPIDDLYDPVLAAKISADMDRGPAALSEAREAGE